MIDRFKKVYTVMSDDIKKVIYEMKTKFEEIEKYMLTISSREMSIALTKLEEASMWATKAWVNHGDKINSEINKNKE